MTTVVPGLKTGPPPDVGEIKVKRGTVPKVQVTGHPTTNNARNHQRPTVPSERQFPRLHRRHRVSQAVFCKHVHTLLTAQGQCMEKGGGTATATGCSALRCEVPGTMALMLLPLLAGSALAA